MTLFFRLTIALIFFSASGLVADDRIGQHHPQAPSAIRTSGVPELPTDLFDALRPYGDIRYAALNDFAPDGQSLLVASRLGNVTQLYRVTRPGGMRRQVVFTSDRVNYGRFLRHGKHLRFVYTMSSSGNENNQVYLRNLKTGTTKRLTDGISRHGLGPRRHHDDLLVIASNRRNGRDTDIFLVDPDHPDKWRTLKQVDGEFWYADDWSPDDRRLLMVRYVSVNESYPHILDIDTGKMTPLPLPDVAPEKVSWHMLCWSPDGKAVYAATDMVGEFTHLARIDLDSGRYTWLTRDIPWNVVDMKISPTGGELAFVVNADGSSVLYRMTLPDHRRTRVTLPMGRVGALQYSPDGKQLGFNLGTATHPTDVFTYRLADGELTRWTHSEMGGLNEEHFTGQRLFRYKSFDGRMIPAFIREPKNPGPHPVLIYIHGGPEGQVRPGLGGASQYWISEHGIAVIAPNVRGSRGYGKTYLKLDNGYKREDAVRDIGALLDWIKEQPHLDESRVGVMGGSYGGYMVLASLVHYGDRIRAGSDTVGISNFVTFLENTKAYRRDLRRAEYGDERDPEMRAFLQNISPSNNADKIRSSLLITHGLNDPRVPVTEARQMARAVRANGQAVWYVVADDEGHGFAKKDNAEFSRVVLTEFWKRHLLPKE